MSQTSDDEDETVVTIVPDPGSAQEVTDVSDQAKSKAFTAFLRPAIMALGMAGAAGLGAAGTLYLQSGKTRATEENPATAREDSHKTPASSASAAEAEKHSPDDHAEQIMSDDPFSAAALDLEAKAVTPANPHSSADHTGYPSDHQGPVENHEATDSDHAANQNDVTQSADSSLLQEAHPGSESHPVSDSHAERSASTQPRTQKPTAQGKAKPGSSVSHEERVTQQAVNLMAIADEDLAGGNYVQAMQAYQSLRQKSDGVPGTAILFRLALCAEAAGRHAAAIEAYRKISGTQADPAWAGVARYGEARCLSAMKRHEGLQTDILRRAILDETEFLPTVRGEVVHLLGRDLWREQTMHTGINLLDDATLIVPEWSADPARLLGELPMLIHETPFRTVPPEFQVLNLNDADPEDIVLRLHCGMTRVESLLRNVITGCRMSCDVSAAAMETLQGRTQRVHVSEQSLALLLDAITISSGVAWQLKDSIVQIVTPEELTTEELRQSRLNAAERLLRLAVMEDPGSPQAGHSRLALSTLLFEQKRAADALQFLQVQVESSPRSVVESEAAFNLGKCLMILNQRDEAVQAFLRSIDSSGGLTDVRIASYIFHSRILLEDNKGKMAVQSMMRGLSLSKGSELEPFAALQLASAYLMQNNPQGANAVLMERREELADGPGRKGAAFLSGLARFRAAVLADRREREGVEVVSALTEFDASGYCGGHWAVLVAGACEELGLSRESTDAYVLALRKLPASDLRNKTILRLAAQYQAESQYEEARLLLATLTSAEASQLTLQARLRAAEVALDQNRPQEAIAACRLLIDSTEEPQIERAALKIMGQAFERMKNHQAAIYCFAGMLPDKEAGEDLMNKPISQPTRPPIGQPKPASAGGHN